MSESPRLRAPSEDGAVVARPSLDQAGSLLYANQERLHQSEGTLLGRPIRELRREARLALLAEAESYHLQAGEPVAFSQPGPVIMAGHQPELFHPGVWVKNFALAGLAKRLQATAVNLVVDNDTPKSVTLRLPSRTTGGEPWPHVAAVPFDRQASEAPYEEAVVQDEAVFAACADRASAIAADWGFTPLLGDFWKDAAAQAARTPLVGERFVRARRALERRWGCPNLEVPISRLCRTPAFAVFAGHVLRDLPRFHSLYNDVVRAYRRRQRIRSRNHPVPDLTAKEDWLEAPFWAWRPGDQRRGRLMVRHRGHYLELSIGGERGPDLSLGAERWPDAWAELERQGLKVRSRALTNTLFARLLLCDLFVHGIGGGLYDELTDALLRRFFHTEPPGYLVLSATLLLPLPSYPATADEERRLAYRLRDLNWNPQRFLPGTRDGLADARAALIAEQPQTRPERRRRFRDLRRNGDQLRPAVADQIEITRRECETVRRQVAANAVLRHRAYPFCLYPESLLRPFCSRFLE